LQRSIIQSFAAACEQDERVVAAFLGGSLATGKADQWSDLDIYVITIDEAYIDFLADLRAFVVRLGRAIFLEDFDLPSTLFFIFADGIEGEIGVGKESRFLDIHKGPFQVLLDKKELLSGVTFLGQQSTEDEQVETLRRQIYGFWHDLSHFVTAIARGQLWWAEGQLEILRGCCVNLARLRQNFADADVGEEAYFKVDKAIAPEDLAPLENVLCSMEPSDLLRSAGAIVDFYRSLAHLLAERYGISYPLELEQIMLGRLEKVRQSIG
jgi:predicted nucleotidyltransferase